MYEYSNFIKDSKNDIETQTIYSKDIIELNIYNRKILFFKADPEKSSDVCSCLFIVLKNENAILKYDAISGNYSENLLIDMVLVDIDEDSSKEIVTAWGDEEGYYIKINKITKNFENKTEFVSKTFGTPNYIKFQEIINVLEEKVYFLNNNENIYKIDELIYNPTNLKNKYYFKHVISIPNSIWEKFIKNNKKNESWSIFFLKNHYCPK